MSNSNISDPNTSGTNAANTSVEQRVTRPPLDMGDVHVDDCGRGLLDHRRQREPRRDGARGRDPRDRMGEGSGARERENDGEDRRQWGASGGLAALIRPGPCRCKAGRPAGSARMPWYRAVSRRQPPRRVAGTANDQFSCPNGLVTRVRVERRRTSTCLLADVFSRLSLQFYGDNAACVLRLLSKQCFGVDWR